VLGSERRGLGALDATHLGRGRRARPHDDLHKVRLQGIRVRPRRLGRHRALEHSQQRREMLVKIALEKIERSARVSG
jgi:hypothetical protein